MNTNEVEHAGWWQRGYEFGYKQGYEDGLAEGYENGYQKGIADEWNLEKERDEQWTPINS